MGFIFNNSQENRLKKAIIKMKNGDKKGFDEILKLALEDYADAEYTLGEIYEFIIKDFKESVKWYTFAADHGHAQAQRCIADMLMAAKGIDFNPTEAFVYYEMAAKQEIVEAQFVLGEFYRNGQYVSKDLKMAYYWYSKASKNGYSPAKIRLEQMENVKNENTNPILSYNINDINYFVKLQESFKKENIRYTLHKPSGKVIAGEIEFIRAEMTIDPQVSFNSYKTSAIKGYVPSQKCLADRLMVGFGTVKDEKLALEWYCNAANNEDPEAQFILGEFLSKGVLYGHDIDKAIFWYEKASKNGYEEATLRLRQFFSHDNNEQEQIDDNSSNLNIADLLIKEAQKQGWITLKKDFKWIPELVNVQKDAVEYFLKFMLENVSKNPNMTTTYTFLITRYLFAKSVEGVIKWGHSSNGKIDILYHPKHLVEGQLEFEIPMNTQKYAFDSLKVGESLFNVYNQYILNGINKGVKIDLFSTSRELFGWVQKLGTHYSLENMYDKLWI